MASPFDISHWLELIGFAEYAEAFRANHIEADVLKKLTEADLKEIGVASLGHRKKLLEAIDRLREEELTGLTREPEPTKEPAAEIPTEPEPPQKPAPAPKVESDTKKSAPIIPPPMALQAETETSGAAQPPAAIESSPSGKKDESQRKSIWKRILASKFLFGSIVAHLLFGVAATFFIVQRYTEKRKVTFAGGPPSTNASTRAMEHKISMAQKKKTGGAPPQAKRIASTGLSALALPDMPTNSMANTVVPGMAAGMGGAGTGMGMGFGSGMGAGMGGGGGGGGGMTMFGFRGGGAGLVGTFYDFKRNSDGRPTGLQRLDRPNYTAILKGFTNDNMWGPPSNFKHHTSKVKLAAKAFFIAPCIQDTEAGKAYQDPDAGPGLWVAHYSGTVTPSFSGEYRWVAFSDNVLIVGVNGKIALDASNLNYVRQEHAIPGAGAICPVHGAPGLPFFESEWFTVTSGSSFKVDVLLGDEGGVFGAGLFLQKKGDTYGFGKDGMPKLPLALFAPLTEAEKTLYRKELTDASFNGPLFKTRAGIGGF